MNPHLNDFKDKLFAAAREKGFSDWEIYASSSDSFSVRVFKGEIDEYKNTMNAGVSFRGTYKGKMGYAYSEKISPEEIPFLIENAAQNAQIIEEEDPEELYDGDSRYEKVKTFQDEIALIPTEDKIQKALAMEKIASGLDPRIAGIDFCVVATGQGSRYLANSQGLSLEEKSNIAQAIITARVEENGQFKTDREFWAGHNWAEFDPEALAKGAVSRALSLLGAKPVPTGVYDILLDADDASSFLGAFSGVFSAERVQKGFSLLKGKLGQNIAAGVLTIRDDPLLALKAESCAFDDEGVASRNKAVVEGGVLKTFLHNTKTAKKDGVPSTGNGFKAGYKASLDVSPTNFYIVPSESSPEELVAEMGQGLLIKDLGGLHSGVNPVSGDFSVICGGYVIDGGKITRPVEQITMAGNFFQVLFNIVKTANDINQLRQSVASPSLWIRGLNISGV